ncbi:MAG: solute-binding protein [Anaerolineae bacterium]|jgi:tungstate transport system substrate-binding protein|nr:solute-binding protein [Anaerolineae bacterium]MBT4311643.1 solute-binding protein [Anaerolineae bacterium]MBT4459812.1 solute-binding protein [Anaerolineae bacterium]MBT4843135.1 solute-binding protein [Anaerolineae bacterium]MBT6323116.1 solute-binding protein [Anaerolineae bacterium]
MKKITLLPLLILALITACAQPAPAPLILATTTSTQDSGLLDLLVPIFEEQSGYTVQTIAVGTGAALKMAEEGNADVLLVHAPSAEKELMDAGFGRDRLLVMHNDFVFVGPSNDPASIRSLTSAGEALVNISSSQTGFVSRGDGSGTHKKERAIWSSVGISPAWDGYIESGQGMGATLIIASEKQAYTMTDRATYLANQDNLDLEIMVEGDEVLLNVYHVITVNPDNWENINYKGALAFAEFMTSDETQALIKEFGIEEYGQPLFFSDAHKTDAELGVE